MILHFDHALVRRLLAHSRTAPQRRAALGQDDPAPPGLWLVGDTGVYLMSNGLPGLPHDAAGPGTPRNLVCYAHEANPETLGFDAADSAKRASFGGDDGVDFIAADDLAMAHYPLTIPIALDVKPESIGILIFKPGPPRGTAGRGR